FSSRTRPPLPSTTLFPYTTLFRSCQSRLPAAFNRIPQRAQHAQAGYHDASTRQGRLLNSTRSTAGYCPHKGAARQLNDYRPSVRSEEHTSELQSRENLVCRLLLEK